MRCEQVIDRLEDHLDELLPDAEAAGVARHLRDCPACAALSREAGERRAVLFAKPEVAPPSARLKASILAAAAPRKVRWIRTLVRYAAVFLAGVGTTLAFRPEPEVVEVPVERVVVRESAAPPSPVLEVASPRVPRRIR